MLECALTTISLQTSSPSKETNVGGTLRGPPTDLRRGDVTLAIYVEKWGFKEGAPDFYDPRITVSVRDATGEVVEPVQVSCLQAR